MQSLSTLYRRNLPAIALAIIAGMAPSAGASPSEGSLPLTLTARTPLPKAQSLHVPPYAHLLSVKFVDSIQARASAETGLPTSLSGADLSSIHTLAKAHSARFSKLIQLPSETLRTLETRAAQRSGIAQPDLAAMMLVEAPADQLPAIANALLASPLTEWVEFQELTPAPPCEDIEPVTPQYHPDPQSYHGSDPGLNMDGLRDLDPATRGSGVILADCEYWYVDAHEDLCDIEAEPDQTPNPGIFTHGWQNHGGAVLGEIASLDNDYGCTGLAPDATVMFFSEWTVEDGYRRVTAITNAIAAVNAGDVVLLEMQTTGASGSYGPAEYSSSVWTVVKNGTDAGVTVVGAAGNGNENLDSSDYADYRARGDSGAILVGAGTSSTDHDKLSFSTYGKRVNVQGWGEDVFSLGYGSYAEHGDDENQSYTSSFGGTSSASPFIASSALALQSLADSALERRLAPLELRDILIYTGVEQGNGGHIGPFPNLESAGKVVLDLKTHMWLRIEDLTGGETAEFSASGATPGESVYFIYSRTGPGETYVPALDVTLDLERPILAGKGIADDNGKATFEIAVPGKASGISVWVQAAHSRRVSIARSEEVQ